MVVDFRNFADMVPKNGQPPSITWIDDPVRLTMKSLAARYLEPHRHYHTLAHVQQGYVEYFKFFDSIDAVTFFSWAYHDSIYDPTRDDNEARSAMLFEEDNRVLRFGVEDVDKIIALILSTTHTANTNIVTDIDLAGLGSPAEYYDENTRLIRTEYNFADDEMWKQGRTAFLKSFVQRAEEGKLYHTREFAAAYTERARNNMLRELLRLEGKLVPKLS